MNEKITELEIRAAHLETTVDELSDIVAKQQDQIAFLMTELKRINAQVVQDDHHIRPLSEETPPPHY